MRRTCLVLAGLSATLAVSAGAPIAPAIAQDDQCGGRLIELYPMIVDKQRVGELQFYYNRANGNNCAIFSHGGPTWGVRLRTSAALQLQAPNKGYVQDEEDYKYRAGPVRIYGRGRCVKASGGMVYKGTYRILVSSEHCGA